MKTELSTNEATIGEMIEKIAYNENILNTPYLASDYSEEALDALADTAYELREILFEMGVEA